jgi:PKD repeat protein
VGDAYLYDPAANSFSALAVNSTPRLFGAGGVVNGVLYTFAGTDTKKFLDTARALDLTAKTWSEKAKLPRALTQPCGCAVNGKVYIFGGLYVTGGANAINPETYVYDTAANSYTTLANKIPKPVYNCNATAYGNYILVLGDNGSTPDTLQVLDTAAGAWTSTVHGWNRSYPNMMVVNDKLYATSGEDVNNYYADRTEIAALTSGPQPLRASASANPTSGEMPLAVQFTGGATGGTAPYTYSWNFGDGSAPSTVQSPSHTYADAGAYTATLTVTDSAAGTATGNVAITVTSGSGPTATASADPTTGTIPLTVVFAGGAVGGEPPYTYSWNFGDGSEPSTEQNPSHTYTTSNTYTAVLTVTDSESKTGTANVTIHANSPVNPPVISMMKKSGNPFRFIVTGSNLQNGVQVFIGSDTTPWSPVTWKSTIKVVIKGGSALKTKVPRGTATQFRFVNPDGGEATFTFQW